MVWFRESKFAEFWSEVGVCAYCAQITHLRCTLKLFFRVAQFELRINKVICVFAICAFKKLPRKLRKQF